MAYLNSVLLEGEYVNGMLYGSFYKEPGFLPLTVEVRNVPDWAEGKEIRIVGHLAIDADEYVYVLAEYVEKTEGE